MADEPEVLDSEVAPTVDPLADLELRHRRSQEKMAVLNEAAVILPEVRTAQEEAAENRRGLWADAGIGAARAAPGAVEETFDLVASLDEKMMSWVTDLGLPDVRFGYDPREDDDDTLGFFKLSPEETEQFPLQSLARVPEAGWREITDLIPETERLSGGIVEGIGKFVAGFATGKKGLQALNIAQNTTRVARVTNAVLAGGIADAMVFDGHEGRLSDFLVAFDSPVLNNTVTQYLATNEDDTELEGRMKNIIEGGGLGLVFDGFLIGLRGLRRYRANQRIAAADAKVEGEVPLAKNTEAPKVEEPEVKVDVEGEAPKVEGEAPKVEGDAPAAEPLNLDSRRTAIAEQVRGAVALTREQAKEFMQAVRDGDDNVTERILSDFNENNIDWSKIESADDIKRVLLETETLFADLTKEAKGGVQSNAQTKRLSNLVDATGTEVDRLFADVRGGGGIAARFYAATRIMMSSAAEVMRTAKIAKEFPADSKEAAEALRAIQMHAAIQAEIKGAQTEIARALQAMGMVKDAAADNFREFSELRASFGTGHSDKAWNNYMDDILRARTVDELGRSVQLSNWTRAKNILIEYTVNAMLSSPKTHAINFVSNVLNTFLYSADRFLGGSWRYLAAGDRAALREARIDMVNKVSHLDQALNLARQAWRDGMPVTDTRQRMEFGNRISIRMDGDSWISKAVNAMGTVIRVPGRALIAGDEFFKAVTRNAEISVQAYRKADEEAVAAGMEYGSKKYETFVQRRMAQLSDPDLLHKDNQQIQLLARDKSRLATFQENAISSGGQGMTHLLNQVPMIKLVIAPFFRTPANIIRQGFFDRTPLGFLFKQHRRTLQSGHPRDVAEQVARMTTGTAAMITMYQFAGVGDTEGGFEVVGKVPWDSSAKAANVKDYSIRIGDTWYQYNRLEPLGMWLGAVADMKYAMEYADDPEAGFAFQQAAMGAFLNNIVNKTWAQSFSRILETAEQVGTGREPNVRRAMAQLAAGEFGKLIPQFVKASARGLEGDENSFQQTAWEVLDIMGERSSLWGEQPLKYDMLGRPIPRDSGFSILMNPFALSKDSDDPVDKEFFRLGFIIEPMPKTLGGGSIDLTRDEYSKLTGLVSETGLHEILTSMVTSPNWDVLNDHLKKAMLKERINEARQTARILLMSDPDVMKRYQQAQIDAALLITSDD